MTGLGSASSTVTAYCGGLGGAVCWRPMSHGRLIAICGPMFSGKTTELIRRVEAMTGGEGRDRRGVLFKPAGDTRYATDHLATHGGIRAEAVAVERAEEIDARSSPGSVVGIDEAHFFGAGLTEVCVGLVARGLDVVVAGLERDHRGMPFEPFPSLLCEADEVIKLSGPCAICGQPALHSQRMVADQSRIVVGGAESYQPRCRACFEPGAGSLRGLAGGMA